MRLSLKNSLLLGLLAAIVSGGQAQAMPPIVIVPPELMAQPETQADVVATVVNESNPVQLAILDLSNQAREQSQLGTLRLDSQLNSAAQRHANDLANGSKFSHQGSDGSSMRQRVDDSGYQYLRLAENIYYQAPRNRPERAVRLWLNSAGHRENILNHYYTEMGVGYASNGRDHFYVQVFGQPQEAN